MKIKVRDMAYDKVMRLPKEPHRMPKTPSKLLRKVMQIASKKELREVNFTYTTQGLEQWKSGEPALILMNHSSFIDLEIAETIFADRPFHIICTSDGFVGKRGLMYRLGCIPTQKFVRDVQLIRDMQYALHTLGNSVLMYPEASYSFDGTETPLPEALGKCVKLLKVPVIMVKTEGAFARDPLYNNLQKRKVDVKATVSYLLSAEAIADKSPEEINAVLADAFAIDNWKWQQEHQVRITEPFRADELNRVLFLCPHCMTEGRMEGKGTILTCRSCGKQYELTEFGEMRALDGETEFKHIPDWYRFEREQIRNQVLHHTYAMRLDVDICMMVDSKSIYHVGEGVLRHSIEGFSLDGCDGQLHYEQKPIASYSLYSDYYWYELGDMICIGDQKALYYCFPKGQLDIVAKARIAAEEIYRMRKFGNVSSKAM